MTQVGHIRQGPGFSDVISVFTTERVTRFYSVAFSNLWKD